MHTPILLLSALLSLSITAPAQAPAKPATLQVKLNYTGAGKVDAKHKIVVFLFNSPDFAQGQVPPSATLFATTKDETVTFPDLNDPTVYIVAVYDPQGEYDGVSGPPPAGASLGAFMKSPPAHDPIKLTPGQTTKLDLPFDDTIKMP